MCIAQWVGCLRILGLSQMMAPTQTAGPNLLRGAGGGGKGLGIFEWGGTKPWYRVKYEVLYVDQCRKEWRKLCREREVDEQDRQLLCEQHLDRVHILARLLVERTQVQAALDFGPDRPWRDRMLGTNTLRLPTFTSRGTAIRKVPGDLHSRFLHVFREHRHKAVPESDSGSSPVAGIWCNSAYDNDDYVLPLARLAPTPYKKLVAFAKQELEQWSGAQITEKPIVYGARMYHRGSICSMHVDNGPTHVLSAIYHLDHHGLAEPWPLDTIDHAGREEKIVAEPGDLILYESATVPHGRKVPLNGAEYVNIFIHFRPDGWLSRIKENTSDGPSSARETESAASKRQGDAKVDLARIPFRQVTDQCLPQGVGLNFSAAARSGIMSVPGLLLQQGQQTSSHVLGTQPPQTRREVPAEMIVLIVCGSLVLIGLRLCRCHRWTRKRKK